MDFIKLHVVRELISTNVNDAFFLITKPAQADRSSVPWRPTGRKDLRICVH